MICNGCGNVQAHRLRIREGGEECCNECGQLSSGVGFTDVYFERPYRDPNLIDYKKPEQRNGVWVESRRHKAELMRKLNVREAGDKIRGGRLDDKVAQRIEREKGN